MQNTGEGWRGLLGVLTDEELTQYGQMALDQVRRETSRNLIYGLMVIAGLALIAWAAWTIYGIGETGWLVYLALGAAGILVYLPWRSVKTRKLWLGHYERVKQELARRNEEPDEDRETE
ncbi:MAG: hypothetical protein K0U74_01770 [Alphaproteobacteria bacterium]|nr:hypothetical protein [Alphaproteobacteria bacterium]